MAISRRDQTASLFVNFVPIKISQTIVSIFFREGRLFNTEASILIVLGMFCVTGVLSTLSVVIFCSFFRTWSNKSKENVAIKRDKATTEKSNINVVLGIKKALTEVNAKKT